MAVGWVERSDTHHFRIEIAKARVFMDHGGYHVVPPTLRYRLIPLSKNIARIVAVIFPTIVVVFIRDNSCSFVVKKVLSDCG